MLRNPLNLGVVGLGRALAPLAPSLLINPLNCTMPCALARIPMHDAAWGTATMEVCHAAVLRSSQSGRKIHLQAQTDWSA